MAKLKVVDLQGGKASEIDVSDAVFGAEVKEHLLWEAVRWQRNKRRAGNAKTKERSEVHGTRAKMFKQKGTGNARHGSKRVNIWRGGGQVHGPRPRDYTFHMNKKARRNALISALSLRASENALFVVKDLKIADSKTKSLAKALSGIEATKALLVDSATNESLVRSSRNLADANFLDVGGLNVYDILRHEKLLISESCLRELESRLGGEK